MLDRIELSNFKCFESVTIPMKRLNVLTGLNGMGKSTVIQSILLLKQSFRNGEIQEGLQLNAKYLDLGVGQDVLYEKAAQDMIIMGLSADNQTYSYRFQYEMYSDMLPLLEGERDYINPDIFGKHFSYLSAYRIDPRELYRITNESELNEHDFGESGEYAIQFLKMHGADSVRSDAAVIDDKAGNTLINQTRLWMNMISPGVVPLIDIDMSVRKAELKYEFIEGIEKTNSYKSKNVGFGITYVLPVVVALLAAFPGDLILLENPEAHIHPRGQRKLGELIAAVSASGVQIVLETHSDHILNGIRIAVKSGVLKADDVKIDYFYKDEKDDYKHKINSPVLYDNGRISEWPEGFFDEWDNALMELL